MLQHMSYLLTVSTRVLQYLLLLIAVVCLLSEGNMASKIWVYIFRVMSYPKQVYTIYIRIFFLIFFSYFYHRVALSAWYRDYPISENRF